MDPDLLEVVRRARRAREPKITGWADRDVSAPAEPGNIDLHARPRVKNPDGSTSTVRSLGIGEDDREVLIPTVVGDRVVSDDDAVKHYRETGEHLGKFKSEHDATVYARALHDAQEAEYTGGDGPDPDVLAAVKAARARAQPETPSSGVVGKVAQALTGMGQGTLDFISGASEALRRMARASAKGSAVPINGEDAESSRSFMPENPGAAPGPIESAVKRQRELLESSAPEPEGTGDVIARAGGYMAAQGAPYIALGGPIRTALGLGEAAALPKEAGLAARAGRGMLEAAKDALSLAPVDIASTAEGPDHSSAGALGDLFDSDNLRAIAKDPTKRALFETSLGFTADVALRALHAGGSAGLRKLLDTVRPEREAATPIEAAARAIEQPAAKERPASPIEAAAQAVDERAPLPGASRVVEGETEDERLTRLAEEFNAMKAERAKNAAPLPEPGPEVDLGPTRAQKIAEQVARAPQEFQAPDELLGKLYDVDERIRKIPSEATHADLEKLLDEKDDVLAKMGEARRSAEEPDEYAAAERAGLQQEEPAPAVHRAGMLPEDTAVGTPRVAGVEGKRTSRAIERNRPAYEGLSDKQLTTKYRQSVRSMNRLEAVAERDSKSFTLGRRTQQQDRVLAIEAIMKDRGMDPRTERTALYEGVKPADLLEQNRDLASGALHEMSDEHLAAEIHDALSAWKKDPDLAHTNERMTLLYEEASKPGRSIPDDVWHSMVAALGRAAVGGAAGYAASRAGADRNESFLTAAAFGGLPMHGDLFGKVAEGLARQGDLIERLHPQGMTEALEHARATLSSLEGKIGRGAASAAERERFEQARSLIRASEGGGLDAAEVAARARAAGAPPAPTDTRDLFGPESGAATVGMTARLAAGAGGAVAGSALDPEHPERGAVLGGVAGLGLASGAANLAGKLRPKVKPPTALEARLLADPAVKRVADSVGQAPAKTLAPRGVIERVKALGEWLRFKGVRETAPMEALEKELTGGQTTDLRDELARARGWLPSATVHLEDVFKPVLQSAEEAPSLARALGKAERGLELAAAGKETTPAQLADWQATVQRLGVEPEVRRAVDDLRAYNRSLLEMKRDAGLLTPEQFADITAKGQAYVPLLPSEVAEALSSTPGRGSRYSPNKSAGVRKMTDKLNEAVTVDPWDQAIVDTYETFDKVARQRVANTVAELVEAHPGAADHLIERLPGKPERAPTDGRMIEALVDGNRRYYVVHDRDLADSWVNFNKPIRSTALRAANGMRKFFQGGVTGTPVFALVNAMRDFMTTAPQYPLRLRGAALSTGIGAAAGAALDQDHPLEGAAKGAVAGLAVRGGLHLSEHLIRTASALNDILGPKLLGSVAGGVTGYATGDEDSNGFLRFLGGAALGAGSGRVAEALGHGGDHAIAREFQREGGGGAGFYARNISDARAMRERLLKEGISADDFVSPKSWWDGLQYVSRAIEEAPRLARYKYLRGAGESVPRSIFDARDLSIDFAVKPGSQLMKGTTEAVPFMNPGIQGIDKLARVLSNKDTWLPAAATIMAPSVLLWGMTHEDPETAEEYQSRPLWERNSYWLIPKKWLGQESGFVRVPKPFELGMIYSSLPERVLDYARTKDPEQLRFALGDMVSQYAPGGWPMPLGPAIAVNEGPHGWDSFRQREIDPNTDQPLSPEMQYDDRTSSLAVAMGKALGRSPAKIDYMIRGYTGSLGSEALDVSSRAARAEGIDRRPAPLVPERPFTSRFSTDPDVTTEPELTLRRKFEVAQGAYNGTKALLDEGDVQGAREFARAHRDDLVSYYQLKPSKTLVDAVAKARRQVRESKAPVDKKKDALAKLNRGLAARLEGPPR